MTPYKMATVDGWGSFTQKRSDKTQRSTTMIRRNGGDGQVSPGIFGFKGSEALTCVKAVWCDPIHRVRASHCRDRPHECGYYEHERTGTANVHSSKFTGRDGYRQIRSGWVQNVTR